MKLLTMIFNEAVGLFVDDGNLALYALLLVIAVGVLVKVFALPPLDGGLVLLIGCIGILADSVRRGARMR